MPIYTPFANYNTLTHKIVIVCASDSVYRRLMLTCHQWYRRECCQGDKHATEYVNPQSKPPV